MSKKHKSDGFTALLLIVGVLALTAVVTGAYLFVNNSGDESENTSVAETGSSEENQQDDKDYTQNDNAYRLHGKLVAYSINNNGRYPEMSADGWEAFLNDGNKSQESILDPFTNEPYKFTDSEPQFGEIEYRYPASCDDQRINFIAANSARSYAFRLRFSDGVRCSHSL